MNMNVYVKDVNIQNPIPRFVLWKLVQVNQSAKFGVQKIWVFNEILVLIFKPPISDYANRER
jgi:hypothetical protein